ncbi:dihydropyoverdine dehydrogenase [Pseudomonas vancouverensis]|uniref:Formylglycine-generating enzyme family protein n=1 Tax=Pseudomonas vancouverensis TaxID=95300 RepID=A0A1H2MJD9_PSEVA|nr:formylglycine-generating enzyme family protein [Pseudomonas vancouverensis]KAB0494801.1 formylglycine-generating enzyme family protein [Pseudomonas vancouverensis]TDB63557.1 formylglycine-generating enzyme family protein [Pseudomonas vancouverensis]SDU93242.1 Formylglycine-generating enzyme, required for sulfatase activity, contains SUMF1/FGE domain [Pseudomonas vancouverensis]
MKSIPHIVKRLGAMTLLAALGSTLPGLALAYTAPLPGKVFKDCRDCPEMVVLPAGTFTMGTPDDEVGREPDEGPMHEVTFDKPFAMSRYQITAGEWNQYMKETGITLPDGDTRPGRACTNGKPSYPQGSRQPAVCMNYAEVSAYVTWLSLKTGQHYHIVSEAQREYAARAGSTGPFPFPFDPGTEYSIATHANTYGPTDGYSFSSPVGSYPPNAFGLYDMHGNVYEWLADCYHPDYVGAPTDGSAWTEPDCDTLRIRGNDWGEAPVFSRSGNRNDIDPATRGDWIGFRVVRTL